MTQKRPSTPETDPKIEALQAQVAELTAALQRERADAVNLRRRHDEQMASLKNVVKAGVVRDLLPVIDNFDRALKYAPQDLEGNDYIKGVSAIVKQFEKTLADMGVERIKTVGEPFDPRYHEAVSIEEGDLPAGKQTAAREAVSKELQSGYKLGTGPDAEVIRHAMVKVKMA